MSVATFTKTGAKASVAAKLDKEVFSVPVADHTLIKTAYIAYLANRRTAAATTKTRGLVRGGGIKPWRQKGTGRARVGSIRSPIWRGGGITFGPIGNQNYSHYLTPATKALALKQALSLAHDSGKVVVLEDFDSKIVKTKDLNVLLDKIGAKGEIVMVVPEKVTDILRASRNLAATTVISAKHLTTFDVMNADTVVLVGEAPAVLSERLAARSAAKKEAKK